LDQNLRVNKVQIDEVKEYTADKQTKWLSEILLELLIDNGLSEDELSSSSLDLAIKLDKEEFDEYGEVLFCEGKIDLKYADVSIQTGETINQQLSIPISCVFLEQHNEKKHQLEEEISIFFGEQEWDLYYYKNHMTDFKSVIHEYVFLNKNPYPGNIDE
jgi:hypothetical protein